jgi:glyoxylase-like metal-dependent hydrolase (beta-lactamase superfamily II)
MKIITIKLSFTNCYLLSVSDNYVLIDTGYSYEWELFKEKLSNNNISINQITHIIITHHHDDHVGLLNFIVSENKNIKIIASVLSPKLLEKGKNDRTNGGGLLNKRIDFLINFKMLYLSIFLKKKIDSNSNLTFPPYNIRGEDILINNDIRLKDIGIDIDGKIILTPGHCIDSISVILDNGIAIVGDAAANFLKFAGTKYCVIFVTDLNDYYKSWERIIAENFKEIYPAHGKIFSVKKLKANIWKNKQKNIVKYKE